MRVPGKFRKHGQPEHPSKLTNHNCLIFYDATHSKDGREWIFTGPDGNFPVRMSRNLETNNPIAFRKAYIYGQGILIAPTPFLIDDLESGALVSILDEYLRQQFPIDALYPHREHLPAKSAYLHRSAFYARLILIPARMRGRSAPRGGHVDRPARRMSSSSRITVRIPFAN
jgi:DNA-binding transcriptional LysR family regulator